MSKPFCGSGSLPAADPAVLRPYSVGVTGSRGTGKSAVGRILQERHGVTVIDTDHITHWLLSTPGPAYDEVLARFGDDCAPVKGDPIDRAILGQRAFASADNKAALEAIMHPRINERLDALVAEQAAAGQRIVFVLVPLLHEAGMKENFDEVWCVVANEQVRLERLMARDGLTEEEALALIKLQLSQTEKAKLSDHLIDNSWDLEKTAVRVQELFDAVMVRVDEYYAAATAQAPVDGDASPVDSDAPPVDGDAPPVDGDAPPVDGDGTKDGDATPTSNPPSADDANARYRKILRGAAEIGTDETLSKLGDVAGTQHQEATAHMSLTVDRATDGGQDLSRQLDVEVKMSVRNKPGTAPVPGGCSCGCGTRCRVDCACQPDCGCGCKKPSPPPPPVDGCSGNKPCGKSRLWLVVLGLFGLLAFLFACLMLWTWYHPPHKHDGGGQHSVTIINNIPPCSDCKPKEPPVEPPPPLVEPPPFNPPAEPPACPPGAKQELDEVPGFAFRFVHNHVRVKVGRWEVTYGESCRGSIVKGFDTDGRLLVYQEYDAHHYMTYQLVMSYFPDRSAQVDRFEGRGNIFTGRSIYRINQYGSVFRAEHYSGLKRLLYAANFVRNGSGTTVALNVEEFDPVSGAALPKKTVEGKDSAATFMNTKFYVFGWFGQL